MKRCTLACRVLRGKLLRAFVALICAWLLVRVLLWQAPSFSALSDWIFHADGWHISLLILFFVAVCLSSGHVLSAGFTGLVAYVFFVSSVDHGGLELGLYANFWRSYWTAVDSYIVCLAWVFYAPSPRRTGRGSCIGDGSSLAALFVVAGSLLSGTRFAIGAGSLVVPAIFAGGLRAQRSGLLFQTVLLASADVITTFSPLSCPTSEIIEVYVVHGWVHTGCFVIIVVPLLLFHRWILHHWILYRWSQHKSARPF